MTFTEWFIFLSPIIILGCLIGFYEKRSFGVIREYLGQFVSGLRHSGDYTSSMNSPLEFRIVKDSILKAQVDVIALKYAGAVHGVDKAVAAAIDFSFSERLQKIGEHVFVRVTTKEVAAKEVLFVRVAGLPTFRYKEIRAFGKCIIETVCTHRPQAKTLALTIHGPGYGLDEREAFLSLMSGLQAAKISSDSQLRSVSIFERSYSRFNRLEQILMKIQNIRKTKTLEVSKPEPHISNEVSEPKQTQPEQDISNVVVLKDYGAKSEDKPKLFIAMPFAPDYLDEYDIAFTEAAHSNGFLCERLDLETFVGDVVSEIKSRILNSDGVVALLNDHNPNVFLEIGFAMAHGKPIILIVKSGTTVPFDVQGLRHLRYSRIHTLRAALSSELSKLKSSGILESRSSASSKPK
jgi:hypothetical protein